MRLRTNTSLFWIDYIGGREGFTGTTAHDPWGGEAHLCAELWSYLILGRKIAKNYKQPIRHCYVFLMIRLMIRLSGKFPYIMQVIWFTFARLVIHMETKLGNLQAQQAMLAQRYQRPQRSWVIYLDRKPSELLRLNVVVLLPLQTPDQSNEVNCRSVNDIIILLYKSISSQ